MGYTVVATRDGDGIAAATTGEDFIIVGEADLTIGAADGIAADGIEVEDAGIIAPDEVAGAAGHSVAGLSVTL